MAGRREGRIGSIITQTKLHIWNTWNMFALYKQKCKIKFTRNSPCPPVSLSFSRVPPASVFAASAFAFCPFYLVCDLPQFISTIFCMLFWVRNVRIHFIQFFNFCERKQLSGCFTHFKHHTGISTYFCLKISYIGRKSR